MVMNIKKMMWGGFGLAFLSSPLWATTGEAKIVATSTASAISGVVRFEEVKEGLKVSAQIENAPVGDHGFHIHEFGDCGNAGNNAGSHYNPENKPHGHVMKDGVAKAHIGDLGNLTIGEDGKGQVEAVIPGLTLSGGKYSVGGRAVVVHEKKDDFGQPTGNAGGRIGCGSIAITGK
jgi:Cu-Zn family superoxide dismutase